MSMTAERFTEIKAAYTAAHSVKYVYDANDRAGLPPRFIEVCMPYDVRDLIEGIERLQALCEKEFDAAVADQKEIELLQAELAEARWIIENASLEGYFFNTAEFDERREAWIKDQEGQE